MPIDPLLVTKCQVLDVVIAQRGRCFLIARGAEHLAYMTPVEPYNSLRWGYRSPQEAFDVFMRQEGSWELMSFPTNVCEEFL